MSIAWENTTTNETQEFSIDPVINRKIKSAVEGLQPKVNSKKKRIDDKGEEKARHHNNQSYLISIKTHSISNINSNCLSSL
jgi:hypothetical protein